MKNWYLTREPNLLHRGCVVPSGAKIYLTTDQAKLHGANIVKTEPPDNMEKSFVLDDYSEYLSKKIQEAETEANFNFKPDEQETFEGAP